MQLELTNKITLKIFAISLLLAACSPQGQSIYTGLATEDDGVITAKIPSEEADATPLTPADLESLNNSLPKLANELSDAEKKLIKDQHYNQLNKVSFLVVNAKTKQVMRSYLAEKPRRLASVTKITTSLAALENVKKIDVSDIAEMLKTSDNSKASMYVRKAAVAIDGTNTPGTPFSEHSSCPASVKVETPAAHSVFAWMKKQKQEVDWTNATINDGAGCDYGNQYTALQQVKVLEFAESLGKAFDGMSYEKLLSISGVDGTWVNHNTDAKGMILAKTGTLNPNSNLAGYFYAKRKGVMDKYYFVVFVEKQPGAEYTTKARNFIESLMRHWINIYSKTEGVPVGKLP